MSIWTAYHAWQRQRLAGFAGGKPSYLDRLKSLSLKGSRVLHFGCGRDRNGVVEVLAAADLIVGVDVDFEALRQYPAIGWHISGPKLPFSDGAFDFAVSEFVLEHLERPQDSLAEIMRVLAPGGSFISVAPSGWSYKSLVGQLVPNEWHAWFVDKLRTGSSNRNREDVYPTYFRANTAKDLLNMATVAHAKIESLEYFNNGPTWFQVIPGLFEIGLLAHKILELDFLGPLRCNILVEFRRNIDGERAAELVECVSCGRALSGEFGVGELRCEGCGRGFQIREGVYVRESPS